jgi:hypothetical protein
MRTQYFHLFQMEVNMFMMGFSLEFADYLQDVMIYIYAV